MTFNQKQEKIDVLTWVVESGLITSSQGVQVTCDARPMNVFSLFKDPYQQLFLEANEARIAGIDFEDIKQLYYYLEALTLNPSALVLKARRTMATAANFEDLHQAYLLNLWAGAVTPIEDLGFAAKAFKETLDTLELEIFRLMAEKYRQEFRMKFDKVNYDGWSFYDRQEQSEAVPFQEVKLSANSAVVFVHFPTPKHTLEKVPHEALLQSNYFKAMNFAPKETPYLMALKADDMALRADDVPNAYLKLKSTLTGRVPVRKPNTSSTPDNVVGCNPPQRSDL